MKNVILIISLCHIFLIQLIGQETDWIVFNKSNSPLTDDHISSIELDSEGYIWVGTIYGGLFKVEGSKWTNFTRANSALHTSYPLQIHSDINGGIWVISGWGDGLISHFDGHNWQVCDSSNTGGVIFNPGYNTCVSSDANGKIFIGNLFRGIVTYNDTLWSQFSQLPAARWYSKIAFDSSNDIWLSTISDGVFYFNGDTITNFNTLNSALPSDEIISLEIENNNKVWVATKNSGISYFDGQSWSVINQNNTPVPADHFNCIAIDYLNRKWFSASPQWGQWGKGLVMLDDSSWFTYNEDNSGLPSNEITSLQVDLNNNLWIGTYNKGVAVFNLDGLKFSEETNLIFYPNPTENVLHFKFKLGYHEPVKIVIVDEIGRRIFEQDVQNHFGYFKLDISSFPAGLYHVSVSDNNRLQFFDKVIKK